MHCGDAGAAPVRVRTATAGAPECASQACTSQLGGARAGRCSSSRHTAPVHLVPEPSKAAEAAEAAEACAPRPPVSARRGAARHERAAAARGGERPGGRVLREQGADGAPRHTARGLGARAQGRAGGAAVRAPGAPPAFRAALPQCMRAELMLLLRRASMLLRRASVVVCRPGCAALLRSSVAAELAAAASASPLCPLPSCLPATGRGSGLTRIASPACKPRSGHRVPHLLIQPVKLLRVDPGRSSSGPHLGESRCGRGFVAKHAPAGPVWNARGVPLVAFQAGAPGPGAGSGPPSAWWAALEEGRAKASMSGEPVAWWGGGECSGTCVTALPAAAAQHQAHVFQHVKYQTSLRRPLARRPSRARLRACPHACSCQPKSAHLCIKSVHFCSLGARGRRRERSGAGQGAQRQGRAAAAAAAQAAGRPGQPAGAAGGRREARGARGTQYERAVRRAQQGAAHARALVPPAGAPGPALLPCRLLARCRRVNGGGAGRQGDAVTGGLRKVTADMKTKNRADRPGVVPSSAGAALAGSHPPFVFRLAAGALHTSCVPRLPRCWGGRRLTAGAARAADARRAAPGAAAPGAAAPRARAPPRTACEADRKWVVEHHVDNHDILLCDTHPRQTVYIFGCRNCTIQARAAPPPARPRSAALMPCQRAGHRGAEPAAAGAPGRPGLEP